LCAKILHSAGPDAGPPRTATASTRRARAANASVAPGRRDYDSPPVVPVRRAG